jgi:hypothetical protein
VLCARDREGAGLARRTIATKCTKTNWPQRSQRSLCFAFSLEIFVFFVANSCRCSSWLSSRGRPTQSAADAPAY